MSTSVSGDNGGVHHCWVVVAMRGKGRGEWGISCRRLQMSTSPVAGDDGGVHHCWVEVARRGKGRGEWGISCRCLQMSTSSASGGDGPGEFITAG